MHRMWAAGAAMLMCLALGGLPVVGQSPDATGAGLSGSLWQQKTEGRQDVYYLLHPDGTLIALTGSSSDPSKSVGLGVWEPTGDRSLVSTLAFGDADPQQHATPGTTTYRSEWVIDEAAETATITYGATLEPADGTAVADETGTSTVTRSHMMPMPADALFPTPPEPAWRLGLGPGLHGVAAGHIALVAPAHAGDPPEYHLSHGDGTYVYVSPYGGNGVGLWAPTGKRTEVLSGWFGWWPSRRITPIVDETTGLRTDVPYGRYGMSDGFQGEFRGSPLRITPLDPNQPLTEPDPALWTASGTVWVQTTSDGLAIRTAYFADGTAISVHPEYGTGAGLWQPTGEHSMASTIGYGTLRFVDARVIAASTISGDGETLSTEYRLVKSDSSGTTEESGTSTATRMRLQALAPSGSLDPS